MDDAMYTFEQLLHQSLEEKEGEDLCKTIQRCQDRVIKVKRDFQLFYIYGLMSEKATVDM